MILYSGVKTLTQMFRLLREMQPVLIRGRHITTFCHITSSPGAQGLLYFDEALAQEKTWLSLEKDQ